jgi:acetylornithine deacetylase
MMMDDIFYNAVDLLKEVISKPSLSREEGAVADLVAHYLAEKGCSPLRKGNNVWATSKEFDISKPTILLNSHIDTVRPVSGWTQDPFAPTTNGDILYGLGSNDAGASLVSLLHTFLVLDEQPQPYNLIFVASAEEEISGKNGIESVLTELPEIAFAVVGEPTEMHPAIAEKGLMVLDCTAQGKSGHAARNEGENAIYKALRDMEWFQNFHFPKTSKLLGDVKMSVTMIQAGTQHNVVPDTCNFVVDIRSNEQYTNQEIFEIVASQITSEVKPRSFRLNSSRIEMSHPFVQRAVMLGKEPFGSPTLSDQALMPFPSVKIGPGHSSRSHTADEYIRLTEIREAIELYVRLLNGLIL